jgi:gamma-glutamyl:cysteine ligase YbdK (ATP-grasp superfamily)
MKFDVTEEQIAAAERIKAMLETTFDLLNKISAKEIAMAVTVGHDKDLVEMANGARKIWADSFRETAESIQASQKSFKNSVDSIDDIKRSLDKMHGLRVDMLKTTESLAKFNAACKEFEQLRKDGTIQAIVELTK